MLFHNGAAPRPMERGEMEARQYFEMLAGVAAELTKFPGDSQCWKDCAGLPCQEARGHSGSCGIATK